MTSVHKFLFEEDFDTDPPTLAKRKAAKEKAAEPPPLPPPPTFSEAELAVARQKAQADGEKAGYARGRAEAEAEASRSVEVRLAGALERIADGIADLIAGREALNAERADQPLRIVRVILARLLPELIRRGGAAEIEAFVSACLAESADEPRLTIRVADDLVDELRPRIEALAERRGFEGRLLFAGDPALGPADCRVDWADGGAERNTRQLLADIEQTAQQLLGGSLIPEGLSRIIPMPTKDNFNLDELDGGHGDASPFETNSTPAKDLEAVYDIPVQISAVLGKSTMQVNQLLKLGRGAVVELDRKVGEAIDIYVNNRLVARGEVVVVEDRLGVTMTEIIKSDRG